MEPAHHFSSKPDRKSTADVPSFTVLVARVLQYHLFRNGEALMYNDSRIDLHMLFRIPMICQYKSLLVFLTDRETFVNSFPSPEKILFCTDTAATVELPNLEPQRHTGDCAAIHTPH